MIIRELVGLAFTNTASLGSRGQVVLMPMTGGRVLGAGTFTGKRSCPTFAFQSSEAKLTDGYNPCPAPKLQGTLGVVFHVCRTAGQMMGGPEGRADEVT